ncbi:MAG: sigma-70 family RNA polymerase sigma factor [Phycisphaerales bacterium]|nr:MAG: sigma-70 family RNA polymerase sigma factor [Phycisphaerales bacterium]
MLTRSADNSRPTEAREVLDRSLEACLMRHWGRLCAVVEYRTDPKLLRRYGVEDLAQEVAVEALARRAEFVYQGEMAFVRWITTIARRISAEWARSRSIEIDPVRLTQTPGPGSNAVSPSCVPGQQATPRTQLAFHQDLQRLREALGRLTLKDREAVLLVRFEGYSIAEAAALMQCSYDAAAKRLYKGIQQLGEHLGAEA